MLNQDQETSTSGLSILPKSAIWTTNFGFLGVQIAFTLQGSQMSRILQTIGANPNNLRWFLLLPPFAGSIVQPAIGYYSNRTWVPKLGGRRLSYLLIRMVIAVIVMILLPNSGSFGFGYGSLTALWFGTITVASLDLSSNVAMQPFKMMVDDVVNGDQESYAYGIQSLIRNTGAVLAAISPSLLTWWDVSNTARKGVVPQSVVIPFYIDVVILVITCLFTIFRVCEYDPTTYVRYHGISEEDNEKGGNWFTLLKHAPRVPWSVTLVWFFYWFSFQCLSTYAVGAIAKDIWLTTDTSSAACQAADNWYGVMTAVQSITAVVWSYVLAKVPNNRHKTSYAFSLLLGAVGYISIFSIHSQNALIFPLVLTGVAWASMNTYPLTMVINALSGKHMDTCLGLFNGPIYVPQMVASLLSFGLFPLLDSFRVNMMLVTGIPAPLGTISVLFIKGTYRA